METQGTTTTAPETTAPPVTTEPVAPVDRSNEEIVVSSEADYARARKDYETKHGPGSWVRRLAPDEQPEAEAKSEPEKVVKAPAEKAAEAKGDEKTKSAAKDEKAAKLEGDDAEPGEITINADGKAIDPKSGRFVPKSAYLRVKGDLTETRTSAEKLKSDLIAARERLSIFTEATEQETRAKETKPAIEPQKPVDPKEDIFGAYEFMAKKVQELAERLEKTGATTAQSVERIAVENYTRNDAESFVKANPDFNEALGHALNVFERLEAASGVSDEGQRKKNTVAKLRDLIEDSRKMGQSWASRVYAIAKEVGYQKKEEQKPNPATPNPIDASKEAEKAAREQIDRINGAAGASQSLRGTGNGGVEPELTRDRVLAMGESEYASTRKAYISKHGRDKWERMVGMAI